MDIRPIASHELAALLALYQQLHLSDDPLPEHAVVQSIWRELLANPRYNYVGGFIDGQLISTCTLTVIPNLTRGCRPYGVIENVVTHAEHRNKGYGKAVLAHALALAWSQRCYKVMLLTSRKENATLQFYESAGFDRYAKQAFVAKPAV